MSEEEKQLLLRELGKLTIGNFFIHLIGILEVFFVVSGLFVGDLFTVGLCGVGAWYASTLISKRQETANKIKTVLLEYGDL